MLQRVLIILFAALFTLSGCAIHPDSSAFDKSSTSSESNSVSSIETPETAISEVSNSYDYAVATPFDMVARGSGNEMGFYQIITNENGYANLLYTDYTTASQIYVCSAPNCEHNTKNCTSYIDNSGFSVFPAVYKETLLLVYSSYDHWSSNAAPSRIECMDMNGENRRTLYTFDSSITLNDGAIVGNDEIVLSGYKIDDSGNSIRSVPFICAVNLDSGEFREIYASSDTGEQVQQNLFLRGVSNTGFILKTISMETSAEASESSSEIYELSFDGKIETELLSFTGSSCFEEHDGKELVYLRFASNGVSLCKRTVQAEQEEVVVDNICDLPCIRETDLPFNQDNLYIVGFVNDYVLLNHLYDDSYDEAGNIFLSYTQYAINLSDGTAEEITLSNNVMATQKPINIVAKFDDSLLVDAVEEVVDGVAYRRTGLISVQDYLRSVPAYTMIQSPIKETLSLT